MPLALWLCAFAMFSAQGARDPNQILEHARAKLQALVRKMSNYTCIETVDRQYFRPPKVSAGACVKPAPAEKKLEWTDRLRFEVTVADNREILSRIGAARFDSRDVDSIVRFGPIGTGSFGSYLIGVFDNPNAVFAYVGEQSLEHRTMLEYHYQVPVGSSRYRVKAGSQWLAMAYEGTFWIDPESLDLERFTLKAGGLPQQTSVCEADSTLDYSGVRIRVGDALLPRESQMQVLMQDGRETNNTTVFSGCRAYQAESTLVFEEAPDSEGTVDKQVVRVPTAIPLGLPVTLALSTAIDSDTAAAGDLILASVVKDVVRAGSPSEVLIPAGAVVHGRITRIEHHLLPTSFFLIGMSFNRFEVAGGAAPFGARIDPIRELAKDLGVDVYAQAGAWNNGTFLFVSKKPRYVMPAGYQSTWTTLATPGR